MSNDSFIRDAESAASGKGMPGVRVVAETVGSECTEANKIELPISMVIGSVIAALTVPLTPEEASPKPKAVEVPPRYVFKGNPVDVNRFFYKKGWTDGLPILSPTEDAVREMLTGTDLPPDHLVGKLIPRSGKATVEKIAVNAVMAGALPTVMPILIAGVEALLDPKCYFGTYGVSTGSWAPFWIFNGPVRHQLHINSGSGAMSPGDIANATIGRAMGLIIKNIGGARKGIEDMGTLGNPAKYSLVVAENEEGNPWVPLHVEHGFDKEDSTVSLFFPNSCSQIWPYGSDDEGIMRGIVSNVIPGRNGLFCLMMIPRLAQTLAEKGWTKDDVGDFIAEYARVPAHHSPTYWGTGLPGTRTHRKALNADDSVSILNREWIRIIVAGGAGNFIGLFAGGALGAQNQDFVTKKIHFPKHWDDLVAKYRDIVPTYDRY